MGGLTNCASSKVRHRQDESVESATTCSRDGAMFVVVNELADNFGRTSDEKSRVPVVSMTGSADVWWFGE
jgi:hypothetical protein